MDPRSYFIEISVNKIIIKLETRMYPGYTLRKRKVAVNILLRIGKKCIFLKTRLIPDFFLFWPPFLSYIVAT